jgi:hypothetical protein
MRSGAWQPLRPYPIVLQRTSLDSIHQVFFVYFQTHSCVVVCLRVFLCPPWFALGMVMLPNYFHVCFCCDLPASKQVLYGCEYTGDCKLTLEQTAATKLNTPPRDQSILLWVRLACMVKFSVRVYCRLRPLRARASKCYRVLGTILGRPWHASFSFMLLE